MSLEFIRRYIYSCSLRLFLPPPSSKLQVIFRGRMRAIRLGEKSVDVSPPPPAPLFFRPVSTGWDRKNGDRDDSFNWSIRRANPVNRCRYKREGKGRRRGRENGRERGQKTKWITRRVLYKRKSLPRTWKPGIDLARDDRLSWSSVHGHKGL